MQAQHCHIKAPSESRRSMQINPQSQIGKFLLPRRCCPRNCCRALAALLLCCCAVLHWSALFAFLAWLICSSTRPLPIREYGEHMERSIAGRRTQGGSCRLAPHIHTSARFCALSVQQLWCCRGILRTAINGFARTAIAAWPHVCDSPRRFATIARRRSHRLPTSSAVRETPSWSWPSTAIAPCNPRVPYNCTRGMDDPDHYSLGQSLPRPLSRPSMPSNCPYTRLSTGSQDKLSAQPFCAPAPGLGLHRKCS